MFRVRGTDDCSSNINLVLPETFPLSHISQEMKISVSECSTASIVSRNELAWSGAARRHANFPALIELSRTVFSSATRRSTGAPNCEPRTRLEREI